MLALLLTAALIFFAIWHVSKAVIVIDATYDFQKTVDMVILRNNGC